MFKINEETNLEARYSEIVQHLPNFHTSYGINCFCIHNNPIFNYQVRDIIVYLFTFIDNRETRLLRMADFLKSEFNAQRAFIGFFPQAMSKFVQYLHSAPNNLERQPLFFQLLISVHSRLLAVLTQNPRGACERGRRRKRRGRLFRRWRQQTPPLWLCV